MESERKLRENQLFVRNIPYDFTDQDLLNVFEGSGPIKHVSIVIDPITKKSKGFGFVTFSLADDAKEALEKLQGKELHGRKLKLELAVRQNQKMKSLSSEQPTDKTMSDDNNQSTNVLKLDSNDKTTTTNVNESSSQIESSKIDKKRKRSEINATNESSDNNASSKGPSIVTSSHTKESRVDKQASSEQNKKLVKAKPSHQLIAFGVPAHIDKKSFKKIVSKVTRKCYVELLKQDHELSETLAVLSPPGRIYLLTVQSKLEINKIMSKLNNVSNSIFERSLTESKLKDGVSYKGHMMIRVLTDIPTDNKHQKQTCRVIIRNLSFHANEDNIISKMSIYGPIKEVLIPRIAVSTNPKKRLKSANNETSEAIKKMKSRGFGFVTYLCESDAKKAVNDSGNMKICNRDIAVDSCISKQSFLSNEHIDDTNINDNDEKQAIKASAMKNIVNYEDHEYDEDDKENKMNEELEAWEVGGEEEEEDGMIPDESILDGNSNSNHHGLGFDDSKSNESNIQDEEDDNNDDDSESLNPWEVGGEEEENDGFIHDDDKEIDDYDQTESNNKLNDPKVVQDDVNEGCTIFIRDLPYDAEEDDIRRVFQKFGKIRFVALVRDKDTNTSKGTAFIKYIQQESVSKAVEAGQSEDKILIMNRECRVDYAVDKTHAQLLTNQQKLSKDKRNIYLSNEGLRYKSNQDSQQIELSSIEQEKRRKSQTEKKRKLQNPLYYISSVRLSIRNLSKDVKNDELRRLCLLAVKNGLEKKLVSVKDLENQYIAQGLTPLQRSEKVNEEKDLLNIKTSKISQKIIKSAKVMLDFDKLKSGNPQSRSFGFVEFVHHIYGLACVREITLNPMEYRSFALSNKAPLFVEFTLENIRKVKLVEERRLKSQQNLPLVEKSNEKIINGVKKERKINNDEKKSESEDQHSEQNENNKQSSKKRKRSALVAKTQPANTDKEVDAIPLDTEIKSKKAKNERGKQSHDKTTSNEKRKRVDQKRKDKESKRRARKAALISKNIQTKKK